MFTVEIEDGREAAGKPSLYTYFGYLSVCLYSINIKTAEPIGPKFFMEHHVTPGKVYG